MTIAQINNIFLLIGCGCVAYFFYLVFQGIYEFKKPIDEINEKKEEKLTQSAYEYYYTLAVNSPDILASDLATARINLARKKGEINKLYTQFKRAM